jgi:hypothetical protein
VRGDVWVTSGEVPGNRGLLMVRFLQNNHSRRQKQVPCGDDKARKATTTARQRRWVSKALGEGLDQGGDGGFGGFEGWGMAEVSEGLGCDGADGGQGDG